MALATQCPHCFTIFRVASDQLKLRGGLVRCGSCREVFNGGEYLVEANIADGQYHAVPGSKAQIVPPDIRPSTAPAPTPATGPAAGNPVPTPAAQASTPPASATPSPAPFVIPPTHTNDVPFANTPFATDAPSTSPNPIAATPEPKVFRSPGHPDYIPDLSSPLKAGPAAFDVDKSGLPNLLHTRALDDDQPAAGLSIPPQHADTLSPLPLTPSNATSAEVGGSSASPHSSPLTEDAAPLLRARSTETAQEISLAGSRPPSREDRIDAPAIGKSVGNAASPGKPEPSFDTAPESINADDEASVSEAAKAANTADAIEDDLVAAPDESAADELDDDEPAFVKKAERRERIGGVVRMTMILLAAAMTPIILLQGMYYWRNQLAATVPAIRPMLNGMCATFHCTVGLPAEIDQLSLESNELQVVPPSQNIYTLSVVVRNRSTEAQAWPHIELTLNNDDEKPVVRRVFRPLDYLASQQVIDNGVAGGGEQQVKLTFELKDALVSGYRIYLFYP